MLIDKLVAKQRQLGLSNTQFASELGISYALWRKHVTGERPLGAFTLGGIARRFPELREEVLSFLGSSATIVPIETTVVDDDERDLAAVP